MSVAALSTTQFVNLINSGKTRGCFFLVSFVSFERTKLKLEKVSYKQAKVVEPVSSITQHLWRLLVKGHNERTQSHVRQY